MSNPSQLLLLADHIKLSLLERQRAKSLDLPANPSQDSNIGRSIESFREGLEGLEKRAKAGSTDVDDDTLEELRSQLEDLSRQFGSTTTAPEAMLSPNDPALQTDFDRARTGKSESRRKQQQPQQKNVRFRDDPEEEEDEQNRAELFPTRYTDDETSGRAKTPDPSSLDNVQIHAYHQQVISEQDEQLDRLGESIGRQRHLAMQVGDELEGQIALLDEVDRGVDRHQGRLDGAKKRLGQVSKKAQQNWGMTTIVVLIVILVLLIVLLK